MTTDSIDINALYWEQRQERMDRQKKPRQKAVRKIRKPLSPLNAQDRAACKQLLMDLIYSAESPVAFAEKQGKTLTAEEQYYISDLVDRICVLLLGAQPDKGISLPTSVPGYSLNFAAPPIKHAPRRPFGGTPESD